MLWDRDSKTPIVLECKVQNTHFFGFVGFGQISVDKSCWIVRVYVCLLEFGFGTCEFDWSYKKVSIKAVRIIEHATLDMNFLDFLISAKTKWNAFVELTKFQTKGCDKFSVVYAL